MIGAIVSYIYVFLLLMIAPALEKYGREVSRKFVHIMTANWWFIVMVYYDKAFWPLIISISFIVVNIITYKYSIFKAIERASNKKEKGTIYYALTLMLLVAISFYYQDLYIGLIGSLVMGYADGFAAIIGKYFNWYPYYIKGNKKSLSGNIAMFVVSFMIIWGVLTYMESKDVLLISTFTALIAVVLETVATKGLDNLIVPLAVVGVYICLVL